MLPAVTGELAVELGAETRKLPTPTPPPPPPPPLLSHTGDPAGDERSDAGDGAACMTRAASKKRRGSAGGGARSAEPAPRVGVTRPLPLPLPVKPPSAPCLGDLDLNGVINGADLGTMLGNWTI